MWILTEGEFGFGASGSERILIRTPDLRGLTKEKKKMFFYKVFLDPIFCFCVFFNSFNTINDIKNVTGACAIDHAIYDTRPNYTQTITYVFLVLWLYVEIVPLYNVYLGAQCKYTGSMSEGV